MPPIFFRNPEVYYSVHASRLVIRVLVQMNSLHTLRGFLRILQEELRELAKNPSHILERTEVARSL
jgi:hypothetical protein